MDELLPRGQESQSAEQVERLCAPSYPLEIEVLTVELLGHIADKWTMLVLEELADGTPKRFGVLRKTVPGISQKMLTRTLRQMERLGLVTREIYPTIPPRVEYQRTALGAGLGRAVCQVWDWVSEHALEMQTAQ
jgi:DNA-binding HxlR family transcriptional regulator